MTEHASTDAVTDTGHLRQRGICFRTVVGKQWECFWTLALEKGQITVEGPFYDTGDSVLAVTGRHRRLCRRSRDMVLGAIGTDGKAYSFTYRLK